METQHISIAISIANFALTWGVALYMYLANKNKATNERITKLENDLVEQLTTHGSRIARLETAAESAPSHGDLAKVYESINELAATVNQLVGENKGQSDTLRLILNQIAQKGMQ